MNFITSRSPLPLPTASSEREHAIGSKQQLENDFARIKRAWQEYRRSNDKHRAYRFLVIAFKIVNRWREARRSQALARRMLRLIDSPPHLALEPHSIVILAGAGSDVDHRCRSTWSRALRFAARHNVEPRKLVSFIKKRGGLNKCAALLRCNKPIGA